MAAPIPMRIPPRFPPYMDRGLVLWIPFYGLGLKAYDCSRYRNHGTIYGAAKWVAGKRGHALNFDAVDDHVRIPETPSLKITGDITIEAWVKPGTRTTYDEYIVTKRDGTPRQYALIRYATGPFCICTWGTPAFILGTTTPTLGVWYHVVGVVNGAIGEVYVNGKLENSGSIGAITDATCDVFVGARGDGAGGIAYPYRGVVDEVCVFARALKANEIKLLYEVGE